MRILLLILFISYSGVSQITTHPITKEISYKEIFEAEGETSKNKKAVSKWAALQFANSNYAVRLDTEDNLIAKASSPITIPSGKYTFYGAITFVVDVAIKDGRYKLEIYNIKRYLDACPSVKTPVFDYTNLSYEEYLIITEDNINKFADEKYRKPALKRLKNKKKSFSDYEKQVASVNTVFKQASLDIYSIAKSLHKYVQKNPTDW
ncbi:MAG: hypothetical protein JKY22_11060 [Flavobacteriaceae bacterium]|nr:hypothetical protein [Flavobacteriaceae bacterium]